MHRVILLLSSVTSFVLAAEPGDHAAPADATQAAGGAAGAQQAPFNPSMLLMVVMAFVFMWFIIIRPQKKEEKRRKEMMSALKRGDKVVTIGGIHGEVATVGENTVDLKVNDETVLTFNRGAIASIAGVGAVAAKG